MSDSNGKLPPGSDGLPLLGETLAFAKNPFAFVGDRLKKHGRVFRSTVLGRKTMVFAGAEATGRFIDANDIMRDGAMPPHIQELFGGRSLPLLDGEVHRARKAAVMAGFTRAALTAYLPVIQQTIERYFARWVREGEIRWLDEMQRLSIEVICTTVIGMKPGEEMDRLRADYGVVTGGFATLPINAPGTPYRKALAARDRIFEVFARLVRERRQTPTEDGLSRMLATPRDGVALTDEEAVLELHHVVIAGYIVFAELGEMVRRLDQDPDARAKLAAEIAEQAPQTLTLESLTAMPYLLQVVNEVKRLCPIIPAVFGRARRDFEFEGAKVPAGWMVMWAIHPSHVSHSVYSNPESFDPDRFSPERAEDKRHEHAFAPQGAGPATGHKCPGLDFATYFMEAFAVVLLRGYSWSLSDPTAALDYSKTPPEPADGIRAKVTVRS